MGAEPGVCLHNSTESDVEEGNERRAEVPSSILAPLGRHTTWLDLHDTLPGHGIGLLVDTLHIPEVLILVFVVRAHNNGNNIQFEP